MAPRQNDYLVLGPAQLDLLFNSLRQRGYEILGPTLREGAIVYDYLASSADLPVGWTDEQQAGKYRLTPREDGAYFGFNVGPYTWKRFVFPPATRLWQAQRNNGFFQILPENHEPKKLAFLGVRACELNALRINDQVFLHGPFVDSLYRSRREQIFIVAVNCTQAGGTCFCASMDTGPKAVAGYDLSLTEMFEEGEHLFLVHAGTPLGAEILSEIPVQMASESQIAHADALVAEASRHMGRSLDVTGIKELLYRQAEHPRWDAVSERCLSCANCTMVCPTCFCSTVEDITDLTGQRAQRLRKWDSCFTTDFSYIHGSSVRSTPRAKYRQWLMHKLAYWIDQFGVSGCTGCGRCITWCPVGIDITEEVRALRETPASSRDEELHNDSNTRAGHPGTSVLQ